MPLCRSGLDESGSGCEQSRSESEVVFCIGSALVLSSSRPSIHIIEHMRLERCSGSDEQVVGMCWGDEETQHFAFTAAPILAMKLMLVFKRAQFSPYTNMTEYQMNHAGKVYLASMA